MTSTLWIIAFLSLSLPSEYRLVDNTTESISLPGPPGICATQEFRSWKSPDGKALHLFFWKPFPPRDLGPMKVASEWSVTVAGKKTVVAETSMFMGRTQHVFVTYFKFTKPDATAMFYASGLDRSEFTRILSAIKIAETKRRE
jgi:hypothetical protein